MTLDCIVVARERSVITVFAPHEQAINRTWTMFYVLMKWQGPESPWILKYLNTDFIIIVQNTC